MDFVQSKFGTNEPLPVELFFPHFLQTSQKVRKKVFNWPRFICTEVTSYKIHTLDGVGLNPRNAPFNKYSVGSTS